MKNLTKEYPSYHRYLEYAKNLFLQVFSHSFQLMTRVIVPILIFILWWVASNFHWMPTQILPTPQDTWHTFVQLSQDDLWKQLQISLWLFLQGLCFGVLGGIILGIAMGYIQVVDKYLTPIFYALVIIPTLAWLPLLMIWLGIENTLKIFIIFKAVLIPISIHTQTGVRDIPPKLKEMAAVLQLKPRDILLKLILPAILPHFFTGLRLAVGAGWTTLIVVELLASSEGIGYLMVTGRQLFQLDIVFVTIVIIGLVGIILDKVLHIFEARLILWPHSTLSEHRAKTKGGGAWKAWVIPALLLALWWGTNAAHWITDTILPSPISVMHALWIGVSDYSLPVAMYQSLLRAMFGLMIGTSIGIVVGILLGLFRPLQQMFAPTLNTLRLIAIFAWIPLITAWFGLADFSKVVFIAMATFFPMFVATWKGMANLSQHLQEASQILRLTLLQKLRIFIFPGIAPSVFSGFRLALLYSWMASFGAEYLMGSGVGIGSYMMAAQQNFEMDRVISATFLVAVLGAFLAWLGQITENFATAWRKK